MKSVSYTNIGQRGNNEDYVAQGRNVYVVCDGVGGSAKGEVASHFVAEALVQPDAATSNEPFTEKTIQQLIAQVQQNLNERLRKNPDEKGMGTTLTAVFASAGSIFLAHIGDSRIYYIKPSAGLFWRTTDHSVVAELVKAGIIKESRAKKHPMSNRITRAIQANPKNEISKADIMRVSKADPGDLIFLCTDGVLEALDDRHLLNILSDRELTIESKLEQIEQNCLGVSSDNNSAMLIELEENDGFDTEGNDAMDWQSVIVPIEEPNEMDEGEDQDESDAGEENDEDAGDEPTGNSINPIVRVIGWALGTLFLFMLMAYSIVSYNRWKAKREIGNGKIKTEKPVKIKAVSPNVEPVVPTSNSVLIDNSKEKTIDTLKIVE